MGSLAAARRTQASFTTFLASTNPPDLGVTIYGANGNDDSENPNYSPKLTNEIAHLPGVRHVKAGIEISAAPLRADGAPRLATIALAYPIASVDGLFFDQDRVTVTQGRMANPAKADEIMMTPLAAHQLGFHLGEAIPYGIYSEAQQSEPGIGTPSVRPLIRFDAKLVGLATLSSEVVEDDIDRVPTFIIMTPALTREVLAYRKQSFSGAVTFGIQTVHGNRDVPKVESELAQLVPPECRHDLPRHRSRGGEGRSRHQAHCHRSRRVRWRRAPRGDVDCRSGHFPPPPCRCRRVARAPLPGR